MPPSVTKHLVMIDAIYSLDYHHHHHHHQKTLFSLLKTLTVQLTEKYFRWIFNLAWISISRSQSSWKGPREHCVIVLTRPAKPELLSGKFSCLSCDFRSLLRQSHFSFRNSSGVVLPITIHLDVETQDVEAFCDLYFLRCCVWLVFSFLRVFFDE